MSDASANVDQKVFKKKSLRLAEIDEVAKELRNRIENSDTGTVAILRRAQPGDTCGAFLRLAFDLLERHGEEEGTSKKASFDSERRETRWLVYASLIARTILARPPGQIAGDHARRSLARGRTPFGAALALADVSEPRVLKLLRAHDKALFDSARAVVQKLVSEGQDFDPTQLARLLLSDNRLVEAQCRRPIGYEYYGQLHRSANES